LGFASLGAWTWRSSSFTALPAEFPAFVILGQVAGLDALEAGVRMARVAVSLPKLVAPPWGEAFSASHGLDLGATAQPVPEIVDALSSSILGPMLFAIRIVENTVRDSLTELTTRFDWSEPCVHDSSKSAKNRNGLLPGGRGRRPSN